MFQELSGKLSLSIGQNADTKDFPLRSPLLPLFRGHPPARNKLPQGEYSWFLIPICRKTVEM